MLGVDTCDAADQEIGLLEIEEGREHQRGDGGCGVYFRLAGCELAHRAVGEAVRLWEERGEAGDGDVLCKKVADGARGMGIGVPDVGFGGKLGSVRGSGCGREVGQLAGRNHTIEIMNTFGVTTSQSSCTTVISLTTTISPSTVSSWRCSRTGDAVTRAAPMKALTRVGNLILTDAAARG